MIKLSEEIISQIKVWGLNGVAFFEIVQRLKDQFNVIINEKELEEVVTKEIIQKMRNKNN